MFESRSAPEQLKSCLAGRNRRRKRSLGRVAWKVMRRISWNDIAIWPPCLDDHHFKKDVWETVGDLSKSLLSKRPKILVFGTNWKTRHSMVRNDILHS